MAVEAIKSDDKKRWYVIHAYSGYENYVIKALRERIELKNMQDFFGDIIVPTEEVVEMRSGQKRTSARKFFPGYVLVQMIMNDQSWHLVKDTPKVLNFIGGTSDHPAAISDKEVNSILRHFASVKNLTYPKLETSINNPGPIVVLNVIFFK